MKLIMKSIKFGLWKSKIRIQNGIHKALCEFKCRDTRSGLGNFIIFIFAVILCLILFPVVCAIAPLKHTLKAYLKMNRRICRKKHKLKEE